MPLYSIRNIFWSYCLLLQAIVVLNKAITMSLRRLFVAFWCTLCIFLPRWKYTAMVSLISLMICQASYEKHHMDMLTRLKTWFHFQVNYLTNFNEREKNKILCYGSRHYKTWHPTKASRIGWVLNPGLLLKTQHCLSLYHQYCSAKVYHRQICELGCWNDK